MNKSEFYQLLEEMKSLTKQMIALQELRDRATSSMDVKIDKLKSDLILHEQDVCKYALKSKWVLNGKRCVEHCGVRLTSSKVVGKVTYKSISAIAIKKPSLISLQIAKVRKLDQSSLKKLGIDIAEGEPSVSVKVLES